jgi:hypothetical protein
MSDESAVQDANPRPRFEANEANEANDPNQPAVESTPLFDDALRFPEPNPYAAAAARGPGGGRDAGVNAARMQGLLDRKMQNERSAAARLASAKRALAPRQAERAPTQIPRNEPLVITLDGKEIAAPQSRGATVVCAMVAAPRAAPRPPHKKPRARRGSTRGHGRTCAGITARGTACMCAPMMGVMFCKNHCGQEGR